MPTASLERVQISEWLGEGFKPLVESGDWRVALMNWEPRYAASRVGRIERHNESDEVFVLIRGRGVLYVLEGQDVKVSEMKTGVLYNVTRGTWHGVAGTNDATWVVVESRNTSLANSDARHLTEAEITDVKQRFPTWLA